ncbi:MAG TPA: endolytic transglycosylase MltG [Anaerolineae bacterium]|nr:endolytic transglycosylase MltG [Anaerolineae bacterium]HIP70756.1 endolytic transglycosylase MltG [Anaerolineae bacterium]
MPQQNTPFRQDPYQEQSGCGRSVGLLLRLALVGLVVIACGTAVLLLSANWLSSRAGARIEGGSPDLSLPQRLYLQTYLGSRAEQLQQPAGSGDTAVSFTIAPGESAGVIAANLAQMGLLNDPELFLNYAHYYGLDNQLEAGTYLVDPRQTIPELAVALTQAPVNLEVTVSFIPGWRLEQMAESLAAIRPGSIEPDEFLAIVQRHAPYDVGRYDFLADLPPDATLEGYLFPDTYVLPVEATAVDLVDAMLTRFGEQVTPDVRQGMAAQGVSLREGITLASIVQREAVLAEERPLIAGVFLNRLRQNSLLQADPTVQYALGRQPDGVWWKSPLSLDDLQLDSPYNTYLYAGLPPGPIASPPLDTLRAVAFPAQTDYFFFVADCDETAAPGSHKFSVTFEEHLANVEQCR